MSQTSSESLQLFVSQIRTALVRFASLHLNAKEDAEDAVQDTLMALLHIDEGKTKTMDLKKYTFGILKNKITDKIRIKMSKPMSLDDMDADELDALLFDQTGHWSSQMAPAAWGTPEQQLLNDQFFKVVDVCVNQLPAKVGRVFSMKEFLECDVPVICEVMNISKEDYWQCMSRARKMIQICINQQWFEGKVLS